MPAPTRSSQPNARKLDTRAAAEWYAAATAFIQALRRRYDVRPQAEGLDSVRCLEAAELNEAAAHWAVLEHRRTELGMSPGRWLHDRERDERLAPPTFLPVNTVRATFRHETGWVYTQRLLLSPYGLSEPARTWLEQHDAHCETLPERDGQPSGWEVRLPDTLTCRLLSGRGQRIHAYLADGSSLRCRAGSLTLVPAGCDVAMARPRKKRADAVDWNSAALNLENHYLWVNNP
ncbi:hypothetical protein [Geopseudomonas aromaticivorans]